jgi:hypothetical protein
LQLLQAESNLTVRITAIEEKLKNPELPSVWLMPDKRRSSNWEESHYKRTPPVNCPTLRLSIEKAGGAKARLQVCSIESIGFRTVKTVVVFVTFMSFVRGPHDFVKTRMFKKGFSQRHKAHKEHKGLMLDLAGDMPPDV